MKLNHLALAAALDDQALLARMRALAQQTRDVTVETVAHLVEVARRGLHRGEGAGKLFGYLTEVLNFSEAAAWNRVQAARAVRRFPIVLEMLAEGSVNLTTIRILVPHLTKENHRAVLAEAGGKGTREVKKIAARLAPRPDVPTTVRKLPAPVPSSSAPASSEDSRGVAPNEDAGQSKQGGSSAAPSVFAPALEAHRPVVEPLAPARYRMQITLDEDMHDDLVALQDLMRREIPNGDAAAIVRRALKLLRHDAEKKTFAATDRPRVSAGTRPGSRDIDAAVQRAVWARDAGRCAFVARDGRRCSERSYLEFHHLDPHALGGSKGADNISLRCASHNAYEAEVVFGPHGASLAGESGVPYDAARLFRNKFSESWTAVSRGA